MPRVIGGPGLTPLGTLRLFEFFAQFLGAYFTAGGGRRFAKNGIFWPILENCRLPGSTVTVYRVTCWPGVGRWRVLRRAVPTHPPGARFVCMLQNGGEAAYAPMLFSICVSTAYAAFALYYMTSFYVLGPVAILAGVSVGSFQKNFWLGYA